MKRHTTHRRALRAFALLALLCSLVVVSTAWGSGTFHLRSTSVSEVSGGWHIYCDVVLPKPPPIAHPTLKFLFTKAVVYERDLVDNNPNPVIVRTPLVGQNPSLESLEVDFADASGKIWNRTHFDFSLTRVRGYEAGEYKLQVRMSDGTDVGSPTSLVLNGDNPVVDRRAIVFDAKNPGMKKISSGIDAGAAAPAGGDDAPAAAPNNGEVVAAGAPPPFLSEDAFKKQPEELHEHPKGCGCDVPGLDPSGVSGLLACSGLALAALGRRRARVAHSSRR
jgi:hypothetical protein